MELDGLLGLQQLMQLLLFDQSFRDIYERKQALAAEVMLLI